MQDDADDELKMADLFCSECDEDDDPLDDGGFLDEDAADQSPAPHDVAPMVSAEPELLSCDICKRTSKDVFTTFPNVKGVVVNKL